MPAPPRESHPFLKSEKWPAIIRYVVQNQPTPLFSEGSSVHVLVHLMKTSVSNHLVHSRNWWDGGTRVAFNSRTYFFKPRL